MGRYCKYVYLSLLFLLANASFAFAADGSEPLPWGNLFWRIATFVIVLYILKRFAGDKIVSFLSNRRSKIQQDLNDIEIRKADAIKQLQDVEQRIASLDAERQSILETYRKQGELVETQIIAQANALAAQITEQARKSADNDVQQAIDAMRAELATLIIEETEASLKKKLTGDAHVKLIDKCLTKVVVN